MSTDNVNESIPEMIQSYEAGESASSLARKYGCSVWSIIQRLRRYGVSIRTNTQNSVTIEDLTSDKEEQLIEIFDGLLLGDGSISKKGDLKLSQSGKTREWVENIQTQLASLGVESKLLERKARERNIEGRTVYEKIGVLLYTRCYQFCWRQRERWYPKGEKVVPSDVRLTPISMAYWFCGDGSQGSRGTLSFYTNGFQKKEVQFLSDRLLSEWGIRSRLYEQRREEWIIGITRKDDAVLFKEIVEQFVPDCFMYKFSRVGAKKRLGIYSDEEIRAIREQHRKGEAVKVLAKEYGCSEVNMRNIVNGKTYRSV